MKTFWALAAKALLCVASLTAVVWVLRGSVLRESLVFLLSQALAWTATPCPAFPVLFAGLFLHHM